MTIPALGESVTESTVTTWLKQAGDAVELDEPIVEVPTDKVDSEVPSPVAGVLLEILVPEDETIGVGTEIARIGGASEASTAPAAAPADAPVEAPTAPAATPVETTAAPASAPAQDTEARMPALGEFVTEGIVTTWLKSVGDAVDADEPLPEVPTDKVDSKVPSPVAGSLAKIRVPEGETVEVGTVVVTISSSAPSAAPVTEATALAAPVVPAVPAAPTAPAAPAAPVDPFPNASTLARTTPAAPVIETPAAVTGSVYVTPIVRKLARELGADLTSVSGTDIGGRVRHEGIEATATATRAVVATPAVPAASTAPAAAQANAVREPSLLRGMTEKMSRLRQTIARHVAESLQIATQLTTVIGVGVTKIAALRVRSRDVFLAKHGIKSTFLPFFVRAATEALAYHPKINATINDKEVTYFDYEHVGIAADTPCGLLVPVVKNAGDKDIAGIAASINDLAARTRESKIGFDELSDSTLTMTNTGSDSALFDTPVLNMSETAIMGAGMIVKRPVVMKGADDADVITIRSMVYLSLFYDHRLVNGADASRFLMDMKKCLEEGVFEADLGL